MATTPTTAQVLTAEGIADSAQDLRQLSADELRRLFAFASSGKINATRVIKNLIWQAYTAIRAGHRAINGLMDQGLGGGDPSFRVAGRGLSVGQGDEVGGR